MAFAIPGSLANHENITKDEIFIPVTLGSFAQ